MDSTNENTVATGKKGLSGPASTVIAAVIGGIFGIVIALIGIYPNLRQGHGITEEELRKQIVQTIPAPKGSILWADPRTGKRHRYWVCSGYPDWNEAEAFCETLGGHLVTITSDQEQIFLADYIKNNASPKTCLWIGILSTNNLWNKWAIEDIPVVYNNWNETVRINVIERNLGIESGGGSAISNYKDTEYRYSWGKSDSENHFEADIAHGQWVVTDGRNPEGWLICEWDYD